jgi:hypothetical protein
MSAIGRIETDSTLVNQMSAPVSPKKSNIITTPFDAHVIDDFKEQEEEDLPLALVRSDSSSSVDSTDSIDSTKPVPRHRSSCLNLVARRVRMMALPSIALLAAANAPGVEAGPGFYAMCIAGCTVLAPPLHPACYMACLPAMLTPTL